MKKGFKKSCAIRQKPSSLTFQLSKCFKYEMGSKPKREKQKKNESVLVGSVGYSSPIKKRSEIGSG